MSSRYNYIPFVSMNMYPIHSGCLERDISSNWAPLLVKSSFAFVQYGQSSRVKTETFPIAISTPGEIHVIIIILYLIQ